MNRRLIMALMIAALTVSLSTCDIEFDPPAVIKTQRFLGIRVDPLEAAPGDEVTFTALVVNKDGMIYTGPIAWAITGNDELREGEGSETDGVTYLQTGPDDAFVWQMPSWEELTAQFGALEREGSLLTVGAAAFKNGDFEQEPIMAFKLFVVADRERKRYVNPNIEKMIVLDDNGQRLEPDADDEYNVDGKNATLWAVPDQELDDLSYHWFAADEDFDPNYNRRQKVERSHRQPLAVHCVMRRIYRFRFGNNVSTYLTGMDWQTVQLSFK